MHHFSGFHTNQILARPQLKDAVEATTYLHPPGKTFLDNQDVTVLGTHSSEIWGYAPFGANKAELNDWRDPSPTYGNACHTSPQKYRFEDILLLVLQHLQE